MRDDRPVVQVPKAVIGALIAALIAQIGFASLQAKPTAAAQQMREPPGHATLRVTSIGDPIPLAQMLTLYLQAFDNQPGISIPFAQLDFAKVEQWLERILNLDPRGQYPLLMASQVYAQVPDAERTRRMLEFAHRQFYADPNRRWPWLAHAAIIAKHRLKDPQLALEYAHALRTHATSPEVPSWARQMEAFFYEDLGEYEAAKVLLGGFLTSGAIQDAHEIRFLLQRLERLEAAEKSSAASKR
jgi:hypothetical protein